MSMIRIFVIAILIITPLITFAQFKQLVGIPGLDVNSTNGFSDYMNALYAISISLAGLLAVVKIVIAGAKYMLSDIVTTKEDAKKDIKGALLGLLIVLAAWLILSVINPDLTKSNILLTPVGVQGAKTPVTSTSPGTPLPNSAVVNTVPPADPTTGRTQANVQDDINTQRDSCENGTTLPGGAQGVFVKDTNTNNYICAPINNPGVAVTCTGPNTCSVFCGTNNDCGAEQALCEQGKLVPGKFGVASQSNIGGQEVLTCTVADGTPASKPAPPETFPTDITAWVNPADFQPVFDYAYFQARCPGRTREVNGVFNCR